MNEELKMQNAEIIFSRSLKTVFVSSFFILHSAFSA
jgi:hypothetical protein